MDPKSKSKAGPAEAAAADAVEQEIDRDRRKPSSGRVLVAATAKEGRRRAGLEFSHAGTAIEFDEISQEQWEQILDDPQLSLRPAKDEAGPAA
ncbi:HI1506-related protein [Bosea minatitlanensis]|uniref:HI1506-related protein n=1 Tax=Bosea minatitlanensis TaxID=128782 RepID=A0ABW0F358_9HYPH|nr:HI1506-related protein [Bosea minatitlanensis]MCT4491801.1 HI1506-related protein [Bosea minatitlanensis]